MIMSEIKDGSSGKADNNTTATTKTAYVWPPGQSICAPELGSLDVMLLAQQLLSQISSLKQSLLKQQYDTERYKQEVCSLRMYAGLPDSGYMSSDVAQSIITSLSNAAIGDMARGDCARPSLLHRIGIQAKVQAHIDIAALQSCSQDYLVLVHENDQLRTEVAEIKSKATSTGNHNALLRNSLHIISQKLNEVQEKLKSGLPEKEHQLQIIKNLRLNQFEKDKKLRAATEQLRLSQTDKDKETMVVSEQLRVCKAEQDHKLHLITEELNTFQTKKDQKIKALTEEFQKSYDEQEQKFKATAEQLRVSVSDKGKKLQDVTEQLKTVQTAKDQTQASCRSHLVHHENRLKEKDQEVQKARRLISELRKTTDQQFRELKKQAQAVDLSTDKLNNSSRALAEVKKQGEKHIRDIENKNNAIKLLQKSRYAFCMVFHARWIFLTTSLRIPPESRSDEGGIRRRVVRNPSHMENHAKCIFSHTLHFKAL